MAESACVSQELAHLTHIRAVQITTQHAFYKVALSLVESLYFGVPVCLHADLVTSLAAAGVLHFREESFANPSSSIVGGRDHLGQFPQSSFDLEDCGSYDLITFVGCQRESLNIPHRRVVESEAALVFWRPFAAEEVNYGAVFYLDDFHATHLGVSEYSTALCASQGFCLRQGGLDSLLDCDVLQLLVLAQMEEEFEVSRRALYRGGNESAYS